MKQMLVSVLLVLSSLPAFAKDTCYEIYGTDKDGKKVEIYFNPVDGSIVKSK